MITRREFVVAAAAGGAALLLGFRVRSRAAAPTLWVQIDPDGTVTIRSAKTEMGQGVWTALPLIVAEELDADWSRVRVEQSPVGPDERFDTGGSGSVSDSWKELRQAGAVMRAMLIAAAATQWGVSADSCETEPSVVVHRASGRRADYGALAAAAMRGPVPDATSMPLKDPKRFRLIGRPTPRLDCEAKITGKAEFTIDVKRPGMLVASVARCPVFGGSLKYLNDAKTRAMPGVRAVVPLEARLERAQLPARVAVVADTTWHAMQGRRALEITWDEGPQANFGTAAFSRACNAAVDTPGRVTLNTGTRATPTIEATYEVPFLAHASMEPMDCVADVRDGKAEIWAGTQSPNELTHAVAAALGIPAEAVTVHVMFAGGGFGRRWYADYAVDAAQISRAVNAPVKVIWSREEDIQHDMYRTHRVVRLRAALGHDGMPTAWEARVIGASWTAFWRPDTPKPEGREWVTGQPGYEIPNIYIDFVYLPAPVPIGAWRAVTNNEQMFACESFIDELAHAAKIDPIDYRLRLLGDKPRARHVLELVRDTSGWGTPIEQGCGRGVAFMDYGGTLVAEVAEVDARGPTVSVRRVTCAFDCGQMVNPDTVRAQIEGSVAWATSATLYGEITVAGGRVVQSNFSDYRVLRMSEMPAVDVHLVESHETPSGVGEPAVPCIAPAIASAVFAATGRRVRRLPVNGAKPNATT
jgi:isoquinoline 1-oxidoreductase subunit beta